MYEKVANVYLTVTYTKGKAGNDRKALHDMLRYMERSRKENAVSEPLKEIQKLVEEIRQDEEIGVNYMKWWEREAYFRKEGLREGEIKGKIEGKKLQLIDMVCKKLQKDKGAVQIAEELETDEKEIQKIIEAAKEFASEYDAEKILEHLT